MLFLVYVGKDGEWPLNGKMQVAEHNSSIKPGGNQYTWTKWQVSFCETSRHNISLSWLIFWGISRSVDSDVTTVNKNWSVSPKKSRRSQRNSEFIWSIFASGFLAMVSRDAFCLSCPENVTKCSQWRELGGCVTDGTFFRFRHYI